MFLNSISDLCKKFPHELSGGERQRVCLAKAVIHRPDVVFADEPTSQLDDENTASLLNFLVGLSKQLGLSLVIVTHDGRVKETFANVLDLSGAKERH